MATRRYLRHLDGKRGIGAFSYVAEFLTVLFALTVITGRIYFQSYWKVFGIPTEVFNTSLLDYAVISPNTAIASVIAALYSVGLIVYLGRGSHFPRVSHPRFLQNFGFVVSGLGFLIFLIPLQFNTSSLPSGMAGLVYGLGYIFFFGGFAVVIETQKQLERQAPSKSEKRSLRWMKHIPPIMFSTVFIILFIASSIWTIAATADQFGSNEAKQFLLDTPATTLFLHSSIGVEDVVHYENNNQDIPYIYAKILAETPNYLYVSSRVTNNPLQIYLKVIPNSQVISISYNLGITPIGH